MVSEFLQPHEATEHFARKSPDYEDWKRHPHCFLTKIFPGRSFVLYTKLKWNISILKTLKVSYLSGNQSGVFAVVRDGETNELHEVSYVPKKIQAGNYSIYVALPTKNILEKVVKRKPNGYSESISFGMMVWQKCNSRLPAAPGEIMCLNYVEFKRREGMSIDCLEAKKHEEI